MIALRGCRSSEQRGYVLSAAVALPGVLCVSLACSEGQYNPTLPMGGSSGMTGNAGSGGSSGSPGGGGSSGSQAVGGGAGGGTAGVTESYDFESGLEGFRVNYFCTGPAMQQNCMSLDAAPAPVVDAGTDAGDAAPPQEPPMGNDFFQVERDAALGDPQPGSLKLTLQLTTGTQSANVALNYAMGIDLTGKTVRAQVRVEPGTTAMTAKFYIKTGMTYYYADGGQVNLMQGSWVTASINAGLPSYPTVPDLTQYVLTDVREIGLEITAAAAMGMPAVVHIDTVQY